MDDFDKLLQDEMPVLKRFVKFRIGNAHDADDVLQETCIAAFKGFGRLVASVCEVYHDETEGMSASECYNRGKSAWKDKDYETAAQWYEKAALRGYAPAQSDLGYCYSNGYGVTEDPEKAVYWYRKAVEQGNKAAQSNLGYCYRKGIGTAEDPEKVVYWYTKAAEQGHVRVQYELGQCYRVGYGVKKDKKQAKAWLKKAAKGGDQDAKAALKELRWPWSK